MNPILETKISTIHKTTVENLTKQEAIAEKPCLYWCNGILFNISYHGNDELISELIKGIWYLDNFSYTVCEERIEIAKWNGYAVEVTDMTNHSTYEDVIKEIKNGIL